ncbi:hypothetical protein A6V39_01215 [Candidatus Mycoplasma haematobovis]|uniref:Uncharacterized protein n=1 Tax=Candidatus Mycoplasma haematobovis TaxID=432608 RepID=A0A1A9QDY0_9MOLU|nr:hypothetical protein [Candidatus Mycoplasma haematobovis]OAL10673.1 hypothetical protein A6V39_01215 [Candidatus Mycoplasma haematobovis]
MKTSSLASIVSACLSAGGAMAGYVFFLKPANLGKYLEWQGFKLAKTEDEALWKSIYEENRGNFKDIFTVSSDTLENDYWKVIKDYCTKAFKKTDYSSDIEKANKWCIDNVQTVKGQMVRNGNKIDDLMTKLEEYQTATAVQGNDKFWGLIGATNDTLEERAKAYQTWCETSLQTSPKNALVKNVNNFCHKKPYSKFSEKLVHEGYRKISKKEMEEKYNKSYSDLHSNTGSNWLEAIGGGAENWAKNLGIALNSWKVDKSEFLKRYENYCKDLDEKKLSEKGNYPDKYSEYRGICAIEENPKKKD